MSTDRQKRLEELQKKKDKIAAMRESRKPGGSTSVSKTATPTDSPSAAATSPDNLEDFLASLTKEYQIPPTSSEIASSDDTPSDATPTPIIPTTPVKSTGPLTAFRAKRRPLTMKMDVVDIDIPPKEAEVYSKGTQTSTDDEVGGIATGTDASSQEYVHAETSLRKREDEIHLQNEDNGTDAAGNRNDSGTQMEPIATAEELAGTAPALQDFLHHTSRIVERALAASTRYDIMKNYALDEDSTSSSSGNKNEIQLQLKLSDERWTKHRSVTHVSWSPKHPELVSASYSAHETGSTDPDGVVLVWSLNAPLQKPEYRFHCQSPVMTSFFSPFSSTILVGGTYSGQIVLWDMRARSTPMQATPLSSIGHTHPVYSMSIVGTKNAHNLVSVSTDGKLCVWSLENLFQPVEVLELHNKQSKPVTSATAPVAVTTLSFAEGEVNCCYVGSEEGALYQAFRHGSKAGVYERYDGHHGPITGLSFHPPAGPVDFSDLFLSSSTDWTCKLWSQKANKPLYSFEASSDYVYDVKWCPSHPSLFASIDGTGALDLWNLNEETEVPITEVAVSNKALNSLEWSADGKKILTGDSAGNLFIYDSAEISQPRQDEWNRFEETLSKLALSQEDSVHAQANLNNSTN